MAKQFAGFTTQQTEVLARKLGFNGPMDQFQNFLKSDGALYQKYAAYENKAKEMVSSSTQKRGFAEGGLVGALWSSGTNTSTPPVTTTPTNTPVTPTTITGVNTVLPNTNSTGQQMSKDVLENPQNYVSNPTTSQIQETPNQLIDPNSGQSQGTAPLTAQTGNAATTEQVTGTPAQTVETSAVSNQLQNAANNMTSAQGTVNQNSLVEAITVDPSVKATVQGQLTELMKQFEGGQVPAWAAGAVRNANAIMGARGLGASSMAGSAVTQAAMESALEIAVRDATTYSTFELKNLDNRQQAAMLNAQAFLQMDLANLSNEQQTLMLKNQSVIQGLFSDQAAENATRQFNATNRQQTDQFFAQLKTQVAQFNAAQTNAMEQFNVNETNATAQFNKQVDEQRQQFNASNRLIIDQSNAEWRRQLTTINNAESNENSRLQAQMQTGMTTAAYNNMMQTERDYYAFAYQTAENALQRAAELAIAKMGASAEGRSAMGQALGAVAGAVINGMFK